MKRLELAGIKVFAAATFPLAGRMFWRGQGSELLWTARDGRLASGETLDRTMAAAPGAKFLHVDAARQPGLRLPSQDVSRAAPDAFILFRAGTAMRSVCPAR